MKKLINAVSEKEIAYVIAKVLDAMSKGRNIACHYSYLQKNTLDTMKELGVEIDLLGKHGYRFHVPTNEDVIVKLESKHNEENVGYLAEEIAYIIEKIRNAKDKPFVCHYSYLAKGTLAVVEKIGLKVDALGQHGYRFHYPTKKSTEWYRLINYGKHKRNENGTFVKKEVA